MKRTLAATALTFAALAAPAQAFDLTEMTEDERTAFRAEIRSYLLENPEVIMEAVAVLEQRQSEQQAAADVDLVRVNADALFNDGYSWVGGNPDGDVTVVEFMDYRCGYCRQAHDEVEQLLETDGNIRFIVKEFPVLGEESVVASRFAIATQRVAGDEAYKQVHDTLINFRGDIAPGALTRLAEGLGIDPAPIMDEMDNPEIDAIIQENRQLASRLQINGTPSFVFDDQLVRGYVPLAGMMQIVDQVRVD
ncbi:DsbA family protein [Lutimaribacter sp. EGI FJ00015]|uniref:DsbA family protein n=1 Tax=Lutimaribacter degradans TaxID=2945989 RepID=A0ACC5ZT02_9RHOB|nr:DsbA family protein [Lutimaribacter sp. EGI FJ00013]MCM2561166.1 DsbA family protein [Lutimaribacter sp. EGI FJ00013]MCO0611885.1 DsbA family protein [Lutimaribacter sp. EGI FJ00015]MCO0634994.1 DsbA family protein [Lutimaribacter sp. EGI FJ00014]